VERLVVGSVATGVVRHAGTTVLVAPPPPPAERVRLELQLHGQARLDRPQDWGAALDTFTRRNHGRRARLEVFDPALAGRAVQAAGLRFTGATYDAHDRRVTIALGDARDRTRHLTHGIADVELLDILSVNGLRDHALVVEDAGGHAVLSFID
jgi:hypothetical protein